MKDNYENKFDEALDEVSTVHQLGWDDEYKVKLFARFCKDRSISFAAWEQWLEHAALDEIIHTKEKDEDSNS